MRNAFTRNAQLDAQGIHVEVDGNRVILRGTVKTWAERRQAANTAWSSPARVGCRQSHLGPRFLTTSRWSDPQRH
ncbi:BON domain-containing protein [uncultured Microbacterium sp.]|uniref:BON domain-containing protein n=1 Tax=uncultured Microbacterium sp. TaxID=191216 RepID=UPI0037DC1E5D